MHFIYKWLKPARYNDSEIFQGSEYWKFDPEKKPPVSRSYPKPISNWEGIPNNIDDALRYTLNMLTKH